MKTNLIIMLAAMSLAAAAQAEEFATTGTVPFAFYVGAQKFAPGTYTIGRGPAMNSVSIRNSANRPLGMVLTQAISRSGTADGKPVLIFKNIDGVYFLQQQLMGSGEGREFRPGPVEREMTAKNRATPAARVAIAARPGQ